MNKALICDYNNLIMANAYYKSGKYSEKAYFDAFFRRVPDGGGYIIFSGLESIIDFVKKMKFDETAIKQLKQIGDFDFEFLNYLRKFKFSGDIYAVPEGTPVFPNEPVITVYAPIIEALLLETYILISINHQSSISTKASRITRAADGRHIIDFSARKSHGIHAAYNGARAAYIGGFNTTNNTLAIVDSGIPHTGHMSHSWVQMFDNEYEAFKKYCELCPETPELLVDTYNVLTSGIPNAIKVITEYLIPQGKNNYSIRLDSGDITYLSKKARKLLDDAGLYECKITASNQLDEYIIRDILLQGAKIDNFIVGEHLTKINKDSSMGAVYKLVAVEKNNEIVPKIKRSENASKIPNPHYKKFYRLFDNESSKAIADLLCVYDEAINPNNPLVIFDSDFTWKQKTLVDFTTVDMQKTIFKEGKCIYKTPDASEIREYCKEQTELLWDEVKRFENPHNYYIDLSRRLWNIKNALLKM
ncbi:MAG: nicotinate phosphoribosyltransferase [Clostridiales bacterium GWF2_38_85]|nr:MAG: nicotinate phosphoribosyltransferase [Clostridiales bacterium GWF2_38_85]